MTFYQTLSTTTPQGKKARTAKSGGKKGPNNATVPVFLRKTFQMIQTADPSIACWSDEGTTFVVKEPEKFAAEVIPEFFKHNNFSSFVRQLNFYGFRKIKSDPLRIRDAETSVESKYWKFRHEKFQQGREDLLVEIKKANQNNDNSSEQQKQEMEALKQEAGTLRSELTTVKAEMEEMRRMMLVFQQQQQQQPSAPKKRKLQQDNTYEPIPLPAPSGGLGGRSTSVGVSDEEMLASLFELDAKADEGKFLSPEWIGSSAPEKALSANNPTEKITHALTMLPKHLQNTFADRLVALVSDPDSLRNQANALTTLAVDAAKQTQAAPEADKNAPQVAAAVLEAYLLSQQKASTTATSAPAPVQEQPVPVSVGPAPAAPQQDAPPADVFDMNNDFSMI